MEKQLKFHSPSLATVKQKIAKPNTEKNKVLEKLSLDLKSLENNYRNLKRRKNISQNELNKISNRIKTSKDLLNKFKK